MSLRIICFVQTFVLEVSERWFSLLEVINCEASSETWLNRVLYWPYFSGWYWNNGFFSIISVSSCRHGLPPLLFSSVFVCLSSYRVVNLGHLFLMAFNFLESELGTWGSKWALTRFGKSYLRLPYAKKKCIFLGPYYQFLIHQIVDEWIERAAKFTSMPNHIEQREEITCFVPVEMLNQVYWNI